MSKRDSTSSELHISDFKVKQAQKCKYMVSIVTDDDNLSVRGRVKIELTKQGN